MIRSIQRPEARQTKAYTYSEKNFKSHWIMQNQSKEAFKASILENSSTRIIFDQTLTMEEMNELMDALPKPPDWFRPMYMICDLTDVYKNTTDLSEVEIAAQIALISERHYKTSYNKELKAAGSEEALKACKEETDAKWKADNAEWRARNGYPALT